MLQSWEKSSLYWDVSVVWSFILLVFSPLVSLQDLSIYNPERTITVKGTIDACANAEMEIMKKLREAFENDMLAVNVSTQFFPFCWFPHS